MFKKIECASEEKWWERKTMPRCCLSIYYYPVFSLVYILVLHTRICRRVGQREDYVERVPFNKPFTSLWTSIISLKKNSIRYNKQRWVAENREENQIRVTWYKRICHTYIYICIHLFKERKRNMSFMFITCTVI